MRRCCGQRLRNNLKKITIIIVITTHWKGRSKAIKTIMHEMLKDRGKKSYFDTRDEDRQKADIDNVDMIDDLIQLT